MKSPVLRQIGATLLVGMALGAGEAAWALRGLKNVPAGDLVLLLFHSSFGYGIAAAVAAIFWMLIERILFRNRVRDEKHFWSVAVGCAVAAFLSIHFVLALVLFSNPRLLPFTAGCVLMGGFCGLLAAAFTRQLSLLRKWFTWSLLTVALLLVALTTAIFNRSKSIPTAVSQKPRMNILLISVDTLRSDRLGSYGYKNAQTPHTDRLAQQSALFEDATSPVPWTGPSHITMLTGLYPWNHGAVANGVRLHGGTTLPEMLSKSGYTTGAFVSGWTLKDHSTSLATRFDDYDEDFALWAGYPDIVLRVALPKLFVRAVWFLTGDPLFQLERPAANTTDKALSWLSERKQEPFFLFVHYFDPHEPHIAPPPFDRLHPAAAHGEHPIFEYNTPKQIRQKMIANPNTVEHIKALYDGEISYVDAQIGRLLKWIDQSGLKNNLLVIFTADHGQSLTEHQSYFRHGEFLYETCVRVPLVIRFPDGAYAGKRYANHVRLVDLTPTILSMLGLTSTINFDGESLLPILNGSERKTRTGYGSLRLLKGEHERARYYVKRDGFKLIWNYDFRKEFGEAPVYEEFYDLRNDPGELQNLASTSHPMLEPLRKLMLAHVRHKIPDTEGPDEEVREALESLGYL